MIRNKSNAHKTTTEIYDEFISDFMMDNGFEPEDPATKDERRIRKFNRKYGSMKEEWRDVKGHEGQYMVSNLGNVMKVNYNRSGLPGIMSQHINKTNGYVYVHLLDLTDGHYHSHLVHRLVAEAFIPNPKGLEQVDHIDNDKLNNVRRNLRWVSRTFNNNRPHAKRLRKLNRDRNFHTGEFVKVTHIGSGVCQYYKNASQAARSIGVSHVMAIKVLRGQFKQTSGFALQYVDRNAPECADVRQELLSTPGARRREELKRRAKARKEAARSLAPYQRRPIVQKDIDGNTVHEWQSVGEAYRGTGIHSIKLSLYGLQPTAGGFVWKFMYEA